MFESEKIEMDRETAIKILREQHDQALFSVRTALETIIPELRESDDERIRKWLVDYFTEIGENWIHREFTCKQIVAYLERQKEQKHPNGCFTCDEYKKGYEEGRRNGFTAGYNKAMKEVTEPYNPDDYEVVVEGDTTSLKRKEQKPEWSEEDEKMIDDIIRALPEMAEAEDNILPKILPSVARKYVERLKSLRPSWKPSKEQMDSLRDTIVHTKGYSYSMYLPELYEQLKAIKEDRR